MRWTMHFKLNPDLSMQLYLALSIKLLKDCESRSSLLASKQSEAKRSKAKQSEAKRSKAKQSVLHRKGDETLETLETSMHLRRVPFARFHCMKLMSTVRVRVKTLEPRERRKLRRLRKLRPDEDRVRLTRALRGKPRQPKSRTITS